MDMDKDTETIRDRLDIVVREIGAMYRILEQTEPQLPEEAKKLLADKKCLLCKKPLGTGKVTRGDHESCNRKVDRMVKSGKLTDAETIEQGMRAPRSAGGRPPTLDKLTEYLNAKESKQALGTSDNINRGEND